MSKREERDADKRKEDGKPERKAGQRVSVCKLIHVKRWTDKDNEPQDAA
jgi:hypothetical protein